MFFRLLYQSFHHQRRSKLLAWAAITLGITVATAMIAVATNIGDKMNRELRSYGANILVYPQEDTLDVQIGGVDLKPVTAGAYLNEADLPKIKGIFWRHNILGFAPFLPVQAEMKTANSSQAVEVLGTYFSKPLRFGEETFTTGVSKTHPWWKVQGEWPRDESAGTNSPVDVLVGTQLAAQSNLQPGSSLQISSHLFRRDVASYVSTVRVSGILSTGGPEDLQIVAPLAFAQQLAGKPGAVRRLYVSALTKPEDSFARRDPASMSPAMRDRWYCSPYANSIALQLTEVLPHSRAEQIRQVAQNEGAVLTRIEGLMLLVTFAALLAAILAVSAAMMTAIMERRREIGLMKAIGATRSAVAALFVAEGALLAITGGVAGFLLGMWLAQRVGEIIFASRIAVQPALLPVVILVAIAIVGLGSIAAIRRGLRFDPAVVLRGDA